MYFNNCHSQNRTPEQFGRALRNASNSDRHEYDSLDLQGRYRTRKGYYAGHTLRCSLTCASLNVEPNTLPSKSHGCPHS